MYRTPDELSAARARLAFLEAEALALRGENASLARSLADANSPPSRAPAPRGDASPWFSSAAIVGGLGLFTILFGAGINVVGIFIGVAVLLFFAGFLRAAGLR